MPIYEFECPACGARFERIVGAGTSTEGCPGCGAEAARRLSTFAPTTRQLTANQKRRLEDRRGTDRDGARTRFKQGLERARGRARNRREPGGGG